MVRHSPLQQLKEAKQIARDYGCQVSERGGRYRRNNRRLKAVRVD